MRLEQLEARCMVPIVAIDVRVERTGVDDQRYQATSARRIFSICSETSD
jgi:hypothetical protein